MLRKAIVLHNIGDFNTFCHVPGKDMVVAPTTCQRNKLLIAFSDVENVKPILERKAFMFFSGTLHGTGWQARIKMVNGLNLFPKMKDDILMAKFYQSTDYMTTLNNTRFGALIRGTTGYAYRIIDTIYSGCIPVFITTYTHYHYMELLDYSKFSVLVQESEMD